MSSNEDVVPAVRNNELYIIDPNPVQPSPAIEDNDLSESDSLFWHHISEFSKWSYLSLIFFLLMYYRDWVFDCILMIEHYTKGELLSLFETLGIVILASFVQVYHYHQEEKWMDANHRHLRTSSELAVSTTNSARIWQRIRLIAKMTVLGLPVFRVVASLTDLKLKANVITRRRAKRMVVDEIEIAAAVTKSERDVTQQTFQVIEQFFETLPQSVMQVSLAARAGETLRFDTWTDGIRWALIIISLLMSAFSSTKYFSDYCKHLKTLHFQDYTMFKHKVDLEVLDWTSWFLYFFMNLIVIVTRFYGICYIFVVYGQISGLIFIVFLYLVQYTWLEVETSCRLMYENPPRGIVTNYSNGIDRWTNVFTFHMLKPNVRTIGFYNLIYLCCIAVFTMTANMLALGTNNNVNVSSNQCSNYNFTYNYTNSSQLPTTIVFGNSTWVPLSTTVRPVGTFGFRAFLFENAMTRIINATKLANDTTVLDNNTTMLGNNTVGFENNGTSPIEGDGGALTYYSLFSSLGYVLIVCIVCTICCTCIEWICETRLQPFTRVQFPLTKSFPFWEKIINSLNREKVDLKFMRYFCICILANDNEFVEVFNTFCFNIFCNKVPFVIDENQMKQLWLKIVRRTSSVVEYYRHSILNTTVWENIKNENQNNVYMNGIIELVDSAFLNDHDQQISLDDFYVFLNVVKYFENHLSEQTSLRLQRTEHFLNLLQNEVVELRGIQNL